MHSTVQHGGNKIGKPNVWANANLAKTVAALDEFKSGFPSEGLTTVSNKWWGRPKKVGHEDGGVESSEKSKCQSETRDGDMEPEDGDAKDEGDSGKHISLVAIRKRIAEEGREAVELGLRQGFGSKRLDKRDQALLGQIFKSSLPKDWITDSS